MLRYSNCLVSSPVVFNVTCVVGSLTCACWNPPLIPFVYPSSSEFRLLSSWCPVLLVSSLPRCPPVFALWNLDHRPSTTILSLWNPDLCLIYDSPTPPSPRLYACLPLLQPAVIPTLCLSHDHSSLPCPDLSPVAWIPRPSPAPSGSCTTVADNTTWSFSYKNYT